MPAQARPANGLSFRLKLLLAAGIVPQLGSCAACGEAEHLHGFSAAAGGVVCSSCEAAAFPLGEEAYRFMVAALGGPLADAPDASELALRQAERAIVETASITLMSACAHSFAPAESASSSAGRARLAAVSESLQVSEQLLSAGYEHPTGPVAGAFEARIRALEDGALSPLASRSYPAQRAHAELHCGLRTPFQRDRDRIVHCKAFRRLKHKTQVFVAPTGDHYRTRLTHTLEVTQVSRTVARALR